MIGYSGPAVVDTSAWTRAADGRLTDQPRRRFDSALAAGQLWSCPPASLEIRFGAQDDEEFDEIDEELRALPDASLSAEAARAAVRAQAELSAAPGVSHRVKPVDLLIAAVAASEGLGVLHYDRDYDTIAEHTSLRFKSIWVAPRGSLD
jgi:predicted nucleic acid-binding protein